jgi:hypothetical protein
VDESEPSHDDDYLENHNSCASHLSEYVDSQGICIRRDDGSYYSQTRTHTHNTTTETAVPLDIETCFQDENISYISESQREMNGSAPSIQVDKSDPSHDDDDDDDDENHDSYASR